MQEPIQRDSFRWFPVTGSPASGTSTRSGAQLRRLLQPACTAFIGTIIAFFAGVSGALGQTTTTTIHPTEVNDILSNPGMGFADFMFGWGGPPLPLSQYPTTRVAYFRWAWADLEPSPGQYNFALVDSVIAQAKARSETLALRIMPGMPAWLISQGVGYFNDPNSAEQLPDHNNPLFMSHHQQLVRAFGARYGGSPDIDHVDIGSVGCWGEWNSACCPAGQENTCAAYMPTAANSTAVIDWYFQYFGKTPLVALAASVGYPNTRGAGWRGDCFGDYGFFSQYWSHMANWYPSIVLMPEVANAWQKAPVQFEACYTMQDWYNKGFDIDQILQKGLDWHMSVFNGKDSAVPAAWRPKVDAWLKKIGYRFVPTDLTHTNDILPGGSLAIRASWANRGVAPAYHAWPLAYRLRNTAGSTVAQWRSAADVRKWLPGVNASQDTVTLPASLAPGTYNLDLAILNEQGTQAFVQLAIAGVRPDLWYPVSQVRVAGPVKQTVTVTPPNAIIRVGQWVQFSAKINGAPASDVTWTRVPALGTISSTGLYTAAPKLSGSGRDRIIVTATSSTGANASATVIVSR